MTQSIGLQQRQQNTTKAQSKSGTVKTVTISADPSTSEASENSRYYAALQRSQGSMSQRDGSRSTSRGTKRASIIVASYSGIVENPNALERHDRLVNSLSVKVKRFNATGTHFRIYHGSTNTTRSDIARDPERTLDISELSNVLTVDQHRRIASCEPNVAFDQLLRATLPLGLTPAVVPEFPGITIGGAFAGSAGESSSFKYGFVDSIVDSVQCILGNGEIREVHKGDTLFNALAGSLGTIGIVTRIDIQLMEAKIFVETQYHRVVSFAEAKEVIDLAMSPGLGNDFVDAIMYSADRGTVITGRLTDHTHGGKIVTFDRRYDDWFYLHAEKMIETKKHGYRSHLRSAADHTDLIRAEKNDRSDQPATSRQAQSIGSRLKGMLRNRKGSHHTSMLPQTSSSSMMVTSASGEAGDANAPTAYVPLLSYLFRYDRGGFWVGRFPFTYFTLPFVYPIRCLMDKYLHTRPMYHALHASGQQRLYIVEDVAVPFEAAPDFLTRLTDDLDIFPLWLCPLIFRGADAGGIRARSLPGPLDAPRADLLLNVGVWGRVRKDDSYNDANRRLESLVRGFHGVKWLYAQMFYDEGEFWEIYDKEHYSALRERYHAQKALPDVFEKIRQKCDADNLDGEHDRTLEKGIGSRLKTKVISFWVFPGLYGLYKAHQGQDYMWKRQK